MYITRLVELYINDNLWFVFQVENVRMFDKLTPRKSMVGTLYLSSTHTIFVENSEARKETWVGIETFPCRQSS